MGNNVKNKKLPKGWKSTINTIDPNKYYVSKTEHKDTHNYPEDNGQTHKDMIAISNNERIIDEIANNSLARQAFYGWSQGSFMGTGSYSFNDLDYIQKSHLKEIDRYIDRSEFTQGVQVHCLGGAGMLTGQGRYFVPQNLDAYMGNDVRLNMPISTAVAADGLSIGQDVGIGIGKNVDYVFNIPPGMKGIGMWIGDRRINGWGYRQRELMLSRDVVWKATSYKKVKYKQVDFWSGATQTREIWQVQMELVGKEKHRY